MENNIEIIKSNNLSLAWLKLFQMTMQSGHNVLQPIIISIVSNGLESPNEIDNIRKELDVILKEHSKPDVFETAATIFPFKAWKLKNRINCQKLSKWYLECYFPRYQARVKVTKHKYRETYFSRMINFHGIKETSNDYSIKNVNQLQHIINIWKKSHRPRHSALQVSLFNPANDHNGAAMSGFPCLQQISFGYKNGSLSINAFYPTQYIVDRSYGNYLGLYHLGFFMAKEMNLKFTQLNCFIGRPCIGTINKSDLINFNNIISELEKEMQIKRIDKGKLFVFEGADGTGKTSIAKRVVEQLRQKKIKCEYFSFPGDRSGTLSPLVYKLHHNPNKYKINKLCPESLQLLHISTHVDIILSQILNILENGRHIILDRYWWSTWVYGKRAGISSKFLISAIKIEQVFWKKILPTKIFLIFRKNPIGLSYNLDWENIVNEYKKIANKEKNNYPIIEIFNDSDLSDAINTILQLILININTSKKKNGESQKMKHNNMYYINKITPAQTTIVYDTYWRFAAERQNVFMKRFKGISPPWTNDPIIAQYKFTNAYRVVDRVSQFLIKNVIYKGDQTINELFFRIVLFKIFNRINTWKLLKSKFGEISYKEFSSQLYNKVLNDAFRRGEKIYSAAYIMPSGGKKAKKRKHLMHLELIEMMMKDSLPYKIAECKSMGKAFDLFRSYPTIGDFLAYQYVTDINYSNLTNFSEMEFVIPGPGAKDGLRKCFSDYGGLSESELIKIVAEHQDYEFKKRNIRFKNLFGRQLQLIDCQNLFCEVDKYSRIKHPEIIGITERKKIKQKFRPNLSPIEFMFPPKWRIKEKK